MNHNELIKAVHSLLEDTGSIVNEFVQSNTPPHLREAVTNQLGEYDIIWQTEPYSNDLSVLFHFKDYNLYIGIDGHDDSYDSYDNIEWKNFYPAEPYQVTETKYRRIE